MDNQTSTIVPVILGTDAGAYGLARSFHEYDGRRSYVLGREALYETRYSGIVDVHVEPDLLSPKFPEIMVEHAKCLALDGVSRRAVLLACSDAYVEQVVRHRAILENYYVLPFSDEVLFDRLIDKYAFYGICDACGIARPETYQIGLENFETDAPVYAKKLGYPLVLKPNHSISYGRTIFPGKRKAYHIESEEQLMAELRLIYEHYRGAFLMQEYIPGDDTAKWVLHGLSNPNGNMVFQSQARMLVEDPSPVMIGTAGAFLGECDQELAETYRRFLDELGYVGLSCIDLKYDARDGAFKVLEMNMRLGRNAYFVTGRGYNLAERLIRTFVGDCFDFGAACGDQDGGSKMCLPARWELAEREHLWLDTFAGVVLSRVHDPQLKRRIRAVRRVKNVSKTLSYRSDFHWIRWVKMLRNQLALAKRLFRRN